MTPLLALLMALASHEDRANQSHLALVEAVIVAESTRAPRSPAEWRALMAAVGIHESGFSRRIIDGQCKPHECDRGRARGAWQLHRNAINREQWAEQDGNIELQARLASDQLKRAYWTCPNDFPLGAINAFAGKRCNAQWPGLAARLATYRRFR
jgi:hypothetical protein